MSRKLRKTIRLRKVSFARQVELIFKEAVAEAIEKHRLANNPISTLRDGQVVMISSEQIPPLQKKTETTPINFRELRMRTKRISRKKIEKKIATARKLQNNTYHDF